MTRGQDGRTWGRPGAPALIPMVAGGAPMPESTTLILKARSGRVRREQLNRLRISSACDRIQPSPRLWATRSARQIAAGRAERDCAGGTHWCGVIHTSWLVTACSWLLAVRQSPSRRSVRHPRSSLAVHASPRIGHSAPGIWDVGSLELIPG